MTRIAALNDFTVGSSDEEDAGPTREALEAEATKNYNEAIRNLASRNFAKAYDLFCLVLQNPFIEKASWQEGIEPGGILPQELALKYSCLKNLGNLSIKKCEYDRSVTYYLEAVRIDRTEVTLWHRLGAAAIKLRDFELALVAFQEGINVNPKHWPCLDQLLSVLFILKLYTDCLCLAAHSLQRDPGYIKALALKDKIFKLQPSLKEDIKFFIKDFSVLFKDIDYDKAKGDSFVSTCETLRPVNKVPPPPPPIPSQHVRKPLGKLTWGNLAQSLIDTYDTLMEEDGMAFAGKIDIKDALNQVRHQKFERDLEELGITPLEPESPHTKKILERGRNSCDSRIMNPSRIASRRRTIELGESRDAFRVSEKRRCVDSDTKSDDGVAIAMHLRKDPSKDVIKEMDEEMDTSTVKTKEEKSHVVNEVGGDRETTEMTKIPVDHIEEAKKEDLSAETIEEKPDDRQDDIHGETSGKKNGAEDGEISEIKPAVNDGKSLEGHVMEGQETEACKDETDNDCLNISNVSDNDFQGFTNASAFKERHEKLVQGKNALAVEIDEDDLGLDHSSEVDDQVHEMNDEKNSGQSKDDGSVPEKKNCNPSLEGDNGQPFLEGQEKNEIENSVSQSKNETGVEANTNGNATDVTQNDFMGQPSCVEQSIVGEEKIGKSLKGPECEVPASDLEDKSEPRRMIETIESKEAVKGDGDEYGNSMMEGNKAEASSNNDIHVERNEGTIMEEHERVAEEDEGPLLEETEGVTTGETTEGIMEGNEGAMEEGDGVMEGNVAYQEAEEDGMEDEGMMEVTETEAAVNALKGIMALQPTEILGLPEPDFDYDNDYAEYFDGGVYEEEEEEEEAGQGDDDGQELMEDIQENIDTGLDMEQDCGNTDEMHHRGMSQKEIEIQEAEHDDGEVEIIHDRGANTQNPDGEHNTGKQDEEQKKKGEEPKVRAEAPRDQENPKKDDMKEGRSKAKEASDVVIIEGSKKKRSNKEKDYGMSSEGEMSLGNKDTATKSAYTQEKRDTDVDDNTATEASDKAEEAPSQANVEVARKSKRTKRGLERELEQLDYWGRRQERDAKRRRRTISSKLLGNIEEAEYLTWADLLRSFVPTSLLNVSAEDKKKKEEEKLKETKVCALVINEPKFQESKNVQANASVSTETMSHMSPTAAVNGISEQKVDNVLKDASAQKKITNGESSASCREIQKEPSQKESDSELTMKTAELSGLDKVTKENGVRDVDKVEVSLTNSSKQEEKSCSQVDSLKQQREELILSPTADEEAQVQAFIMQYEDNGGILHLLQQFLRILMKRHKFVWPINAAKTFTQLYPRVRNHVTHASPLNLKESWQRLRDQSLLALTHWELSSSIYNVAKLNTPTSEQNSMPNPFAINASHLEDDMFRLILMLGRGDVWVEDTPQFHTRLRWLQAQIRMIRGQPEEAASYLELLLADLDRLAEDNNEYVCHRVRVETDVVVVSNSEVKRQLNVLQRSHMLEQVVNNYTDCRYREVADLLTTIYHEPLPKSRSGVTLPSRQTQLAILIDSLYKLSEFKDVIYWGSFALTEALMRYNRAEAEEEKNRWAKTLMKITDTVNAMLVDNITIVNIADPERLVEMVSTLIRMLVVQLDRPQSAQVLPFETLVPWMLLHRILVYKESTQDSVESKKVGNAIKESEGQTDASKDPGSGNTEKGSEAVVAVAVKGATPAGETPVISSNHKQDSTVGVKQKEAEATPPSKGPVTPHASTLFLITAHDELGKHSWCCADDGIFLLYCLEVLLVELRRCLDDQHRQLLHHTLEQVTFCLYSHPSKKSKHKHLRDHGVPQIAFCWERAMQLYQYYRPNVLPDFQTSQIPSITDDAAVLFKRIIALLPDEAKPTDHIAEVEAYINGEVKECSYTPFTPPTDIIKDCFYLLGDYYFKGKEWVNAIRFYKTDLSINHKRLESWAPLGLSMKAMLESQLNSCEVIEDEEEFFSLAKAAVQCLRQALHLDQYHTNLWVEFGGLVYMVHSHASRLLKQDLNPDISLETFDMLENFKNEMLVQAEICFMKALSIHEDGFEDEGLPDERWLYCYMLGKVAEKMSKPPQAIMRYYVKAAQYLHNIRAKYPSRINYNSPQEFSVEALEMYYRIHAFILKYLHLREGRDVEPEIMNAFVICLDELSSSPFLTFHERKSVGGPEVVINDAFLEESLPQKKRPLEDQEDEGPPSKKLQSGTGSQNELEVIGEKNEGQSQQDNDTVKGDEGGEGKKDSQENEKKESDDEIQVVEEKVIEKKKDHFGVITKCLAALHTCLSRFQEHYKAMYRLAHYYHTSKFHKDNVKAQNYLLGSPMWQSVGYMPVNGLFHERKVWIQQPRNSNFFHGIWRIPNDEIDRPGSFAAHMYRCVSLILDILPQMKDFFMVMQIALALRNSPDKDKKYLRDNERELLSEHATQVGLQAMKDKFKVMFKADAPVQSNRHLRFLLDVYKCYKQVSKHLPGSEPHFAKMLTDAYASYKGMKVENRSSVLREADSFCHRSQYLQHRTPVASPNIRNPVPSTDGATPAPVARRGRPPLTGRGRGRGRGSVYRNTSRTVGDMLAVQQAYKIYENLISTQTLLNKKDLGQSTIYSYQKQLETYQTQLLKYLQIPSVSQYFQASLQGLGTTSTKLPPPKDAESKTNSSPVQPSSSSTLSSLLPSQGSTTVSSLLPSQGSTAVPSLPPSQGSTSVSSLPPSQGSPTVASLPPSQGSSVVSSLLPNQGSSVVSSLLPNQGSSVVSSLLPNQGSPTISNLPPSQISPAVSSLLPSQGSSAVSSLPPSQGSPTVSSLPLSQGSPTVSSLPTSQGSSTEVSKSSPTQPVQQRTTLDALAARSQVRGISITSVSATKVPCTQSQPLKPSMSVTVSTVKPSGPAPLKVRDVSVVSVSQTSPVKTSISSTPTKPEPSVLSLPSSTTVKPVTVSSASSPFKSASTTTVPSQLKPSGVLTTSAPFKSGSLEVVSKSSVITTSSTLKTASSLSSSTTIKPVTSSSGGSTSKQLSQTTDGSVSFKSSSSVSSVPKLPAGTTLTRPRETTPIKGSGPKPQLQANPRPVKGNLAETMTVKKVIPPTSSSSVSISKPNDSSSSGRSSAAGLPSKATLPKDMTITPAPRVKNQNRQPLPPSKPVTSPSTSFLRAFEASLGLSSSSKKNVPDKSTSSVGVSSSNSTGSRSISQSQTSLSSSATAAAAAANVAQLSTHDLIKLAYGSGGRGQSGGGGGGHGQSSRGRGQSPSNITSYSSQYSKSPQQQRAPSKQLGSAPHMSSSSITVTQSSVHKSQPPSTSGSHKQLQSSQSRMPPASSHLPPNKPINKPTPSQTKPNNKPTPPPKPPQKSKESSDDIITLD